MILPYLLIFIGSVILFSLLIPKPQIEDAKAQEFSEDGFPKATENSPIPYLTGKTRLESPNTLFAGNFRTVAQTTRVRTGLFSKKTVITGYKYYLTLDLGFCLGGNTPCTLHELYIDNNSVWTGTLNTDGASFNVSSPALFGGDKNGGGFTSTCRFYTGSFSQVKDPYIDALPDSGGLLTPYRGVTHIVFEDAYIGEQPSLRAISAVMSRYPNNLTLTGNNHIVGEGSNWAEALYDILTNQWGGLAADPNLLDGVAFFDAGETLFAEGQSVSGVIQNATNGESVIKELLRQADSLLSIDPVTNLVQPILLRADYNPATLPVFSQSDIKEIKSFTQTLWAELVSELKGGFKDPTNEYQNTTVVAQDLAVANITGKLKTTNIALPFVKDKSLANAIVGRELNQLSQIVTQVKFVANRTTYSLRPGSVIKWTWPDYGIDEMILRVKDVSEGDDFSPEIVIEAIRDTYDNVSNAIADPVGTGAQPLSSDPLEIVDYEYFDAPEFIVLQLAGNEDAIPSESQAAYLHLMAEPADSVSVSYGAVIDITDQAFDQVIFPLKGTLGVNIDEFDNFANTIIPSLGITNVEISRVGEIGNAGTSGITSGDQLIYINGEILGYSTHTDNGLGSITLTNVYRALLNTKQQSHLIGDTVFFIDGAHTSESLTEVADSPASISFLPSTGPVSLGVDDVTPYNLTVVGAIARPDPPDYTQLDSSRAAGASDGANITISWRHRDKSLGSVQLASAVSDAEPTGITYTVEVYNITDGGGAIYTQAGISGLTHSFDLPGGNASDVLEIRVSSTKDGLTSVTYDPYRLTIAGVLNGSSFSNTNFFGSNIVAPDGIIDGALFTSTNYFGVNGLSIENTLLGLTYNNPNLFGVNELVVANNALLGNIYLETNTFGTNVVESAAFSLPAGVPDASIIFDPDEATIINTDDVDSIPNTGTAGATHDATSNTTKAKVQTDADWNNQSVFKVVASGDHLDFTSRNVRTIITVASYGDGLDNTFDTFAGLVDDSSSSMGIVGNNTGSSLFSGLPSRAIYNGADVGNAPSVLPMDRRSIGSVTTSGTQGASKLFADEFSPDSRGWKGTVGIIFMWDTELTALQIEDTCDALLAWYGVAPRIQQQVSNINNISLVEIPATTLYTSNVNSITLVESEEQVAVASIQRFTLVELP